MNPEWDELKELKARLKARSLKHEAYLMISEKRCLENVLGTIDEIELCNLRFRVAEILRKADTHVCRHQFDEIAEALESGDLSKIEKWVEK